MKQIGLLFTLILVSYSTCTPSGQRDFRFEAKKKYHLIYMDCTDIQKSYADPSQGTRRVFMVVFRPEGFDLNGEGFKSRTYYIEKERITFIVDSESADPIDTICWERVPNRRADNFTEDAVTITSNDQVKLAIYNSPCP